MYENRWTHNTGDLTARYIVRGYFTGDSQHWFRVFDRETGDYLPGCYREQQDAITDANTAVSSNAP